MTRFKKRRGISRDMYYQDGRRQRTPVGVLIVTEGKNTEKEYFTCLKDELKPKRHHVNIVKAKGTAPMNVVKHAKLMITKGKNIKFVYCVFDRDGKTKNFNDAVAEVQSMNKGEGNVKKIEAITSIPCFEFWFSLHVRDKRPKYDGMDSPCKRMEGDIKNFTPFNNYSKDQGYVPSIFDDLKKKRSDALDRANSILKNVEGDEIYSENPSTRVCVLVEDLIEMGSNKSKK